MALVNYDYDSSDPDDDIDEITDSNVILHFNDKLDDKTGSTETSVQKLLSALPKKQNEQTKFDEEKIEDFIPKYQPKPDKVKITIPLLSKLHEDDEEDEPERKKPRVKGGKSGLLAMLPPVKSSPLSTKSFVPKVVKQKKPTTTTTTSLVPDVVRKRKEVEKADSDDDIEVPDTFDEEMWQKVCGRPKKAPIIAPEEPEIKTTVNAAPEPVRPYEGLDNAAFKELVGRSKRPVNVKLVDINEADVVAEADVWMTKSLTDPEQEAKPAVENPVDPTRKKKHHITYLAEQAKANEQEFKNQWAASKYTRTQTRAKYGF